ncbi:uncharacterized protein LOC110256822 [Sus scrofa]|uniref:uncharacterized protein LOC110256822 n=1 Tax=Sus scrofa TaxID=9823 RepID=UPI000A2B166C|nr:uncharacterized protein LOC110256822 [Sus scrofa]
MGGKVGRKEEQGAGLESFQRWERIEITTVRITITLYVFEIPDQNFQIANIFFKITRAARRKQDLPSLPSQRYLGSPVPRARAHWACSSGRAASGERAWSAPRLYLSRARPPRTGPVGHLAGAEDTAQGGDAGRGGCSGAALGVPEPRPNFSPRSLTFGGRRSGTGRGERSSWKEQPPPLHNMASSASSSPAGAEGTPPAQGDYGAYSSRSSRKGL